MKKITIIDYGTSNLKSIDGAFKYLGYNTDITNDKKKLQIVKLFVLPGVGAFPVVMDYLKKRSIQLLRSMFLAINLFWVYVSVCNFYSIRVTSLKRQLGLEF